MERALVPVLLVLLLPPGGAAARQPGVLCRVWAPETRPYLAVFRCPEKRDPPDARFCCGTCRVPYCCSSEQDQLDQRRCHAELLATPTPPPAPVPDDWYYMCFFLGVVTIGLSYACANLFSTEIQNCLRRRPRCLRGPWFSGRRQEVQLVQMGSLPALSVIGSAHSSTCVSLATTSSCVEESEGTAVWSPAWDDSPVRGHLPSNGIPENEAIILSPAALLNTSVSCPILEAAVEMED